MGYHITTQKSGTMLPLRFVRRLMFAFLAVIITGHVVWQLYSRASLSHGGSKPLASPFYRKNISTTMFHARPDTPILVWWDSVYTDVDELRHCGKLKCRVTNNRNMKDHPDTAVFLFYGSNFKPYNLPLPRKSHHLWALMHEESPRNAYILSHYPSLTLFNFTSTYSQKADYPITLQWLPCPDWLQDKKFMLPLVDKNRLRKLGLAPILYLQSDCGVPSDRDNFVKNLQNYIPVDSYGTCVTNKKMDKKLRFHDNMSPLDDENFFRFAARYKFTLAMENYVCNDYITEKVWRPLRLGSIPIVFSAPNIKEYLPTSKSAINIADFEDIHDLARYIHLLDSNDKLYREYQQYKGQEIQNDKLKRLLARRDWLPTFCKQSDMTSHPGNFSELKHPSIFSGYECFLCNKVHEMYEKGGHVKFQADALDYDCPSPRKFDDHGRYSVHDDRWSAEWTYGKYEADAMLKLYQDNLVMSEKEFYKFVKKVMKNTDSY